jgi:hypothetical protein
LISSPRTGVEAILTKLCFAKSNRLYAVSSYIYIIGGGHAPRIYIGVRVSAVEQQGLNTHGFNCAPGLLRTALTTSPHGRLTHPSLGAWSHATADTRPNTDAGHDMGYFWNATDGKAGQVELVHSSIRLAIVVPSSRPSFSGVTPNDRGIQSSSASAEYIRLVWCSS